jgi:hypothetical protein
MKTVGIGSVVRHAMTQWASRGLDISMHVWRWVRAKAAAPLPISRVGAYTVAAFIVSGLCLLQDLPLQLPGLAIGLLGAGAVVVAVRTDALTKWEKIGWTCVAFLLFFVEVRTLYRDREEQEARFASTRLAEEKHFSQIAHGISATIQDAQKHFDETMARSDKLLGLSKESLDDTTGGDSYAFIAALMGEHPPFQLLVVVKGKHGVHNASAEMYTVQDRKNQDWLIQQLRSKIRLPLGNGEFLPGTHRIDAPVARGRYLITVVTKNQRISEQLDIAQCSDGLWSEAIKLNGPGQKENKTFKGLPGCHEPFAP